MDDSSARPDLQDFLLDLELPRDMLSREIEGGDAECAQFIVAMHDEAILTRRRKYATGLAVAFIAFVEELASQLPSSESLADALLRYPPREVLPGGRTANTLTVSGPIGLIGLRKFYNAAEHVIHGELRRYDYPIAAPHATQSWFQERPILDALLRASPGCRRRAIEMIWERILELQEFFIPSSQARTLRPFAVTVREFPNTQRGEPAGAVLQALGFAYFTADAPNVILETAKVGAGSRRAGRVGDIDGWSGGKLVLAVEVKDIDLNSGDVHQLDGFVRNLARWPDATAIVLARSFDQSVRDFLDSTSAIFD